MQANDRVQPGHLPAAASRSTVEGLRLVVFALCAVALLSYGGRAQSPPTSQSGDQLSPKPPAGQDRVSSRPCGISSLEDMKWVLRGEGLSHELGHPTGEQTLAMTDLRKAARQENLTLVAAAIPLESLADLEAPVIGHFKVGEETHFATLEVGSGWIRFLGRSAARVMLWNEISTSYTGRALVEEQALRNQLPPPLLTLDETLKDFGTVVQGQLVTHAFILRNQTNQQVRLIRAEAPADCSAVISPTSEIPPGEVAWLSVTWRPSALASASDQQRHIALITDHPGRRVYLCSLLAAVSRLP